MFGLYIKMRMSEEDSKTNIANNPTQSNYVKSDKMDVEKTPLGFRGCRI